MHQIRFPLGLSPRPLWGSLQRSPTPSAVFKGSTSKENKGLEGGERKGREMEGKGEGEGSRGGNRKGGEEGENREGEVKGFAGRTSVKLFPTRLGEFLKTHWLLDRLDRRLR